MKYTQTTQQFWNSFDTIALYMNIYRRQGETNKQLTNRQLLIAKYNGNATEQGIKNCLLTAFYLTPSNTYTNDFVVLQYTPLTLDLAIRYSTSPILEITDYYTKSTITDYEWIKADDGINYTNLFKFENLSKTKVRFRRDKQKT